MIQKLNQKIPEYGVSIEGSSNEIRNFLLDTKIIALNFGIIFTDNFISSLEEFTSRNSIIISEKTKICCPRCLKAHAIKKAKQFSLGTKAVSFIEDSFKCENGHHGYYIDKEELVRI